MPHPITYQQGFVDPLSDEAHFKQEGVNIRSFGAIGDGVTDDATAMQKAIDSLGSYGGTITIPKTTSEYIIGSEIQLPNAPLYFRGYGGTKLKTSNGNILFSQTNHVLTRFSGLHFSGDGIGIEINTTETSTEYYDFEIFECSFQQQAGVYGIYLQGAREGQIHHCYFETCDGIYRTQTTNTQVSYSIFKNCGYGVFDDGDNTSYSDGLMMDHLIMIGCSEAIVEQYVEYFELTDSMIDYNDQPIQIYGIQDGNISDSYLSSRTTNPTINIGQGTKYTGVNPQNIKITDSFIITHSSTTGDCIDIANAQNVLIQGNDITFYQTYGISYSNTANLRIIDNNIIPASGSGTNSIYASAGDDSSNIASMNNLSQAPSIQYMRLRDNNGYKNHSWGTVALASSATSVTASHGLSSTPDFVMLTPRGSGASGIGDWWVSNITSTQFTVSVATAPSSQITFGWEARFGQ